MGNEMRISDLISFLIKSKLKLMGSLIFLIFRNIMTSFFSFVHSPLVLVVHAVSRRYVRNKRAAPTCGSTIICWLLSPSRNQSKYICASFSPVFFNYYVFTCVDYLVIFFTCARLHFIRYVKLYG